MTIAPELSRGAPPAGPAADAIARFRPHQYLARENRAPGVLFRVEFGWACRFQLMPDGRRQITGLFLPGDYCEPQWALGRLPTQPVVALTEVRALRLPCDLAALRTEAGEVWCALLACLERQSAWLVTLGRKVASERVADLLLDVFVRMRGAGLACGSQCAMPLTQTDIADIIGLTPVHVNRTLQAMRADGLIELKARWLSIPDLPALRRAAGPARA